MSNELLLKVEKQNADIAVEVPISSAAFGSGLGSDYMPAGLFKFRIDKAYWEKGKKEQAVNLFMSLVATDAGDYEGSVINNWSGAPVGDPESDDYKKKMRTLQTIYGSILSGLGKLEGAEGKTPPFVPSKVIGKFIFAETEEEDYKGEAKGRVRWFVTADRFAEKPGPSGKKAAPKSSSTSTDSTDLLDDDTSSSTSTPAADADALDGLLD